MIEKDRVALYCRLSDEDRKKLIKTDDSESIQNQKTMLLKYAFERDWEVYDLYSDDDFSGADEAILRPEFTRLMKDAEARKFNIVLVKSQSRFTRDMEYVEKIIHKEFLLWGIRFVSIVDNADTSVVGNKKSRQINGLVNEWYVEDLSENIKFTFEAKKRAGKYIGAFTPYGYVKDPKDKNHFLIDEIAANIVRMIFKMYLEGYGLTRIAQHLNELGYPCPAEYKRQSGLNYVSHQKGQQGRIWRSSSVNAILQNQMYTGDMVQGKSGTISYKNSTKVRKPRSEWVIIPGMHEPIIDRHTFELVANTAKGRNRPEQTGKRHVFSGKLRCANCGAALIKHHTTHKGEASAKYFHCPMKKYGVCPEGAFVKYEIVYNAVYNELRQIINQYVHEDDISKLIQGQDKIDERIGVINKEISAAHKAIHEADNALKNLYLDKVKGLISDDQFSMLSPSFTDARERCKLQIKILQEELDKCKERIDSVDQKKKAIQKYIDMQELSKEIVDEFVECVYVKNTEFKGVKEITIKWNL